MYRKFKRRVYLQGSKKSQIILGLVLLGVLLLVAGSLWYLYETNNDVPQSSNTGVTEPLQAVQVPDESQLNEVDAQHLKSFDEIALQQTVDAWAGELSNSALASVVLSDDQGIVLASLKPDERYFTASIYKLYVAYEGYRLIDEGLAQLTDPYLGERTFGQCLDVMIRESDSPCAEKLWVQLGKAETTETLKTYGITNTSLVGLSTTAADVATMLARIARGEGLSSASQALLLQSMKDQIYRNTLNKGFSDAVTVYNKIGFNEQLEYHDTAIIELTDGRQLIVSVLTRQVGTTRIVELAKQLEQVLNQSL